MNDVNQVEKELVQCDVCLKEIPTSESKNTEASDYVAHFCGLDCHEKWMNKAKQDQVAD